jgi:hypothetical protein
MGQQANSGRNASLDQKKQRAAGRQQNRPEEEQIREYVGTEHNRRSGGAGGNDLSGDRADARDSHLSTGEQTRTD